MTSHANAPKPSYMRWHPTTGEPTIFNDLAEIPEGHLDHHPNDPAHAASKATPAPKMAIAEKPKEPALALTRKEIRMALGEGGIAYDKNAPTKDLYDLLDKNLRAVLTEMEVPFDAAADAKTLLGLLPPGE